MKKYKLTVKQRKKARDDSRKLRERRRKAGLKELRVTCHPDDAETLKRIAKQMLERREEGVGI